MLLVGKLARFIRATAESAPPPPPFLAAGAVERVPRNRNHAAEREPSHGRQLAGGSPPRCGVPAGHLFAAGTLGAGARAAARGWLPPAAPCTWLPAAGQLTPHPHTRLVVIAARNHQRALRCGRDCLQLQSADQCCGGPRGAAEPGVLRTAGALRPIHPGRGSRACSPALRHPHLPQPSRAFARSLPRE